MTATDEAARVWEMMTRSENPMHAMAALDMLREQMNTDDVAAVKAALYGAAADAITHEHLKMWDGTPHDVRRYIRAATFGEAVQGIEEMRRMERVTPDDDTPNAISWCAHADAALALCREIEAL